MVVDGGFVGRIQTYGLDGKHYNPFDPDLDIVSEWQEPTNEEELDKPANEFVQGFDCAMEISPNLLSLKKNRALAKSAFKVGYRKAKNK